MHTIINRSIDPLFSETGQENCPNYPEDDIWWQQIGKLDRGLMNRRNAAE